MTIGPQEQTGVFIVDRPAMARFLSWDGPVGSDMRRRKRTLEFRARSSVGVRSGKLKIGIESRESVRVDGIEFSVGNWSSRYAAAHHQGAEAHEIRARNAPMLKFYWAKKNVWVSTKRVWHPGNRANPYLTRWLREAVS